MNRALPSSSSESSPSNEDVSAQVLALVNDILSKEAPANESGNSTEHSEEEMAIKMEGWSSTLRRLHEEHVARVELSRKTMAPILEKLRLRGELIERGIAQAMNPDELERLKRLANSTPADFTVVSQSH